MRAGSWSQAGSDLRLILMCARTVLSTLVAVGLLVSVAARALAAGDEPESGAAPSTSTTTTTTTGGSGTIVTPIGSVETTTVQALPPVEAPPPKPIPELDERTAYMVGKHTLKLGILAFEYGIIQQLSVGTDPPSWVLRAVISVLVPNLHLKYQILDRDPVAVAVEAAGYYASLSRNDISGNLIDVPLSLFVSVKVHPRITLHAEGAYVYARVFGTGDVTQASLERRDRGARGPAGPHGSVPADAHLFSHRHRPLPVLGLRPSAERQHHDRPLHDRHLERAVRSRRSSTPGRRSGGSRCSGTTST